jgi:hypothetical membrane protein
LTTGGGMGILAPISAFLFIALSIASYSQFSWTNNALSDLGVVSGVTATLFNYGLYTCGVMALWFAIGLFKFLSQNALGKIGAIIFAGGGVALEGIGWAPENVRPYHYIFSVAFFSLVPIALLAIAAYFFTIKQKRSGVFTLLVALFAAVAWVFYFLVRYVPGVAIPELLSALAVSAWAIAVGWRIYQAGSRMYRSAAQ